MQKCYRVGTLLVLGTLLPVIGATAIGNIVTSRNQTDICGPHIRAAEVANGIPRGLLRSIALAESGGYNKVKGANAAWPWTLNNAGRGYYFRSKQAAHAQIVALRRAGQNNIDVGCMQVNLYYHGRHFASFADALDPAKNTAYAGRLLRRLFQRTGNWRAAVGRYHSATPWRSQRYAGKVYRFWNRQGGGVAVASARPVSGQNRESFAGTIVRQIRSTFDRQTEKFAAAMVLPRIEPASGNTVAFSSQAFGQGMAVRQAQTTATRGIVLPPSRPKITPKVAPRVAAVKTPQRTGWYRTSTSGLSAGGAYQSAGGIPIISRTGSGPTSGAPPRTPRAVTPNAAFAEYLMSAPRPAARPAARAAAQPVLKPAAKPTRLQPTAKQPSAGARIGSTRDFAAARLARQQARRAPGAGNGLQAGYQPGVQPLPTGLPQASGLSSQLGGVLNSQTGGQANGMLPGGKMPAVGMGAAGMGAGTLRGAAALQSQSSLGGQYRGLQSKVARRPGGSFGAAGAKRTLKLYRQNGAPAKTYKFTRTPKVGAIVKK